MNVIVEVSSEDIDKGCRRDNWHCPVALAIFRATGRKVSVASTSFRFLDSGRSCVSLPISARYYIDQFDRGVPIKPFTFRLEIPNEE